MIFDVIASPMFVTYAVIVCIVILLGLVWHLHRKIRKMLIGKNAQSLEDSLITAKVNLEKLNIFQKNVIDHLETVEKRLNRSVQAVETVRFNPFKGTGEGGNQSFSTAFVSENGDGVVISSLYSRDRISIFSKPLVDFKSTFELTEEEQNVITNSQKSLS